MLDAWNRTMIAKDIPAHTELYTEDAMQVTPFGIISGRAAITKSLEGCRKVYTVNPSTLTNVV